MLPQWLHIVIMTLIGIGITLLSITTIIELLHVHDLKWKKPKYITVLERTAFGCFGIVLIITVIIAIILTILL